MDEEAQKWQRRYQRERQARQEAERLLEGKSLDLYRRTCQLDELVAKQEVLIEERTRDFEKANEQVVMLSDAISHTLNGVIITGKDDKVIWANAAVERLTGYTVDDMLGKSPGELLQGPETEETVRAYMREHIDQRLPFNAEVLNYNKSGQPYWIHLQATPVIDAKGDFKYYVAIQSDITEEKKNKTRLAREIERANEMAIKADEANAAKTKFLATMSHELRTPLNGIIGYAQILGKNSQLEDTALNQIRVIRRSGEHLLALINELLDISKIESGGYTLTPNRFDLDGMLTGVIEMIRAKADEKLLQLRRQFDTHNAASENHAVQVTADSRALRQVLLNLLGNAIKFTDKGMVSLEVEILNIEDDQGEIRFAVTDTGRGISKEERSHIFDAYQQIDSQRDAIQGTGLGLYIAQKLVHKMGGQIEIESTLNSGSCFYFTLKLPIELQQQPNGSTDTSYLPIEENTPIGYLGSIQKVLVIDDNKDNRDLLNDILSPLGFEVEQANNGRDGLRKIKEKPYDIVLSDVVMPFLGGYELVEILRNDPDLAQTNIVAISASLMQLSKLEQERIELFDGFISKPIQIPDLLQTLKQRLNLQWVYPVEDDATDAATPRALQALNPEDGGNDLQEALLQQMWLAAHSGDIKTLKELLPLLEQSQPELHGKIHDKVRHFKMNSVAALLEAQIQPSRNA